MYSKFNFQLSIIDIVFSCMTTDVFLGPICEYVIAPVARYAGVWNRPVITAGALAESFVHKAEYATLTRMMGSYPFVGEALRHILHVFNWSIAALLYHDNQLYSAKGHSDCHFILGAVFKTLGLNTAHKSFSDNTTALEYRKLLLYASKQARSEFRFLIFYKVHASY